MKQPNVLSKTLKITATILVLFFLFVSIRFYIFDYYAFENYILTTLQKPYLKGRYEDSLPLAYFANIQRAALAIGIGCFLFIVFLIFKTRFFERLAKLFSSIYNGALQRVRLAFTFQNKWIKYTWLLVFVAAIVHTIWRMYATEMTGDEAATYSMFSVRNLLFAVGYYPVPNNHIFFSAITTFFVHLPINATVAFRLSLMPAMLVLFITYTYLIKKHCSEKWLVPGFIMLYMAPMIVLYTVLARGYMYVAMFAVLALALAIGFSQGRDSKKRFLLFTIINILGCYTVLTYLYFLLPVVGILFLNALLNKQYKQVRYYIYSGLGLILVSLILYTPALITSGMWSAWDLIVNKGDPTQKHFYFIEMLTVVVSENLGLSILVWFISVLLILLALFNKRQTLFALIFAASLAYPIITILVLGKTSFARNWVHLPIIFAFGIPYLMQHIQAKWRLYTLFIVTVLSISMHFVKTVNHYFLTVFSLPEFKDMRICSELLAPYNPKTIFFDMWEVKSNLEYYDLVNHKTPLYYTNNDNYSYSAPYNPSLGYDVILKDKNKGLVITNAYEKIASFDKFEVYIKKGLQKQPQ